MGQTGLIVGQMGGADRVDSCVDGWGRQGMQLCGWVGQTEYSVR